MHAYGPVWEHKTKARNGHYLNRATHISIGAESAEPLSNLGAESTEPLGNLDTERPSR